MAFLLPVFAAPATAQTPPPAAPQPATEATVAQQSHLRPLDPTNPYSAKITAAASSLAATLTDRQAVALALIRGNFGAMGAVRIAEQNVDRAVLSCVKSNPSLGKTLPVRFASWKDQVGAALGDQQQALSRTVHTGIAGDPKKILTYLNLIDRGADYAARRQDYPPPTALPACQSLMDSLNRTSSAMAALLEKQQWPTPDSLDALQAARAKAASAAPAATPPLPIVSTAPVTSSPAEAVAPQPSPALPHSLPHSLSSGATP